MTVDTVSEPRLVSLASSTPFVARESERALLADALARRPSVAVVEGEAGVGKTRLLDQVLHEHARPGMRVLRGGCREGLASFPLAPVADALRSLTGTPGDASLSPVAGVVGRFLPELAGWLPEAPEPLADTRAERHRLYRGLVEVLGAVGPVAVVVEDLHWADDATRSFLDHLLGAMPDRLALVVSYRPHAHQGIAAVLGAVSRLPAEVSRVAVTVQPLDRDATSEFVAAMLGGQPVSAEFATYLWDKTGGLPFALEEVLRLLADRDDLVHAGEQWVRRGLDELGVPAGFAATVHQRVQALSPAALGVLQAASVLAVPSDEELLARLAEVPVATAVDALASALQAALLVEAGDGVEFRHALTRQAVYEAIPGPQRRQLHRRAAEVLEQQTPSPWARLAHHHRQAGSHDRWVECAESAADDAASAGDDATALRLLEDVVADDEVDPATCGRIAVKLAEAALQAGEHRRGLDLLEPVLDQPWLPSERRGELRLLVGWLLGRAGDAARAMTYLERACKELDDDPGRQAEALSSLADIDRDGTVEDQLRYLDAAAEAAERQSDPAVVTRVAVNRATAMIACGDPAAADAVAELPREGTTLAQSRQITRGHVNIADSLLSVGRYADCEQWLRDGRELVERLYAGFLEPFESLRVLLRLATGQWDGLEEDASRLLHSDFASAADEANLVLGVLRLARGDTEAGETTLCEVIDNHEQARQFAQAWWGRGELAMHRLARGDVDGGRAVVEEGLALMRTKQMWTLATELIVPAVTALGHSGDLAAADDLVAEVEAGLQGRHAPAAAAAVVHAHAVRAETAGDFERADAAYAEAESAWTDLPRPQHAARAGAARGRCLLTAGEAGGEEPLRAALETFCRLEAIHEANRVRSTLRDHGLHAYRRRGRRGYGEELSPREREVAELAAAGMTNREIAETLVLSRHTVSSHMTRVLRKLDIDSRTELDPDELDDQ